MTDYIDDVLQPITDDQVLSYCEIAKKHLPATYRVHHFLLKQYQRKKFLKLPENQNLAISNRSNFNLFKHKNGNVENCTFVAITVEGREDFVDDYNIFVFSLETDNRELEECLKCTKRINWNLMPLFLSPENQHMPIIRDVLSDRNLTIAWELPHVCLWLEKEKAKKLTFTIPDDIFIKDLHKEDAELIDSSWAIQSPGSLFYVQSEIVLNWGLGIYEKDTNQLVSWILVTESYACGNLVTLSSKRGKGYGKLVTAAFCKAFAERENQDLVSYVICTNNVSRNLFNSLGFKEFSKCFWLKTKRNGD